MRRCLSTEDEVTLCRKLRGIESVVERDIRASVSHQEVYELLWPASITSPAAVKDRFSQPEQDKKKKWGRVRAAV